MNAMTKPNTETLNVAINKLVADPHNVRKIRSDATLETLADSIAAEGLLQNLVVREVKSGKYAVVGGERRRNALLLLVKQKQLKASDTVPCRLIADTDNALSASLAENIHRAAMHPVDQFRAFVALADSGLSISEIAVRHGASERLVEQRLKLGRLSPVLLAAFAEDKINLAIAIAFTLTDDHTQQEGVFESLSKINYGLSEHRVKGALTEDETPSTNKLVKFVGRDAYEAAGGTVREDIFGDLFYCQNSVLLLELAQEKLEDAAQQKLDAGWKWVNQGIDYDHDMYSGARVVQKVKGDLSPELQIEYDRLTRQTESMESSADELSDEDEEKLDELKDRLYEIEEESHVIPEMEKSIAGWFLFIDSDGAFDWRGPLIRKADDPELAPKQTSKDAAPDEPKGYSKALRDDLAAIRLEALRIALLGNATVARDLLAFHTVRDVLTIGYNRSPIELSIKPNRTESEKGYMGVFAGRDTYVNMIADLSLDWFELKDTRESFAAFCALDEDTKAALQAYACVLALIPQLADEKASPALESAAEMISLDVSQYWTPDASFFKRTTKGSMLELAQSQGLTPEAMNLLRELRKGDIADSLGERFQGSIGSGNGFDSWLPECMQTGLATEAK